MPRKYRGKGIRARPETLSTTMADQIYRFNYQIDSHLWIYHDLSRNIMGIILIISDYDGDMDWYVDNPIPTLNIPDTPWFSQGFTHIWDHTMGVFYI